MNLSLSPQSYSAAGLGIGVTPASPVWMHPRAEISYLPVRDAPAVPVYLARASRSRIHH
ncbi:hypothetical protein ACFYSH_27475 [Streptomyces sp. NPDC005791]|uniref:hypothetical protein n=1 Tax=Streptomyces sp. NPDC005791 TaxID=3364732 RepID=UPI00369EA195